MSRKFGPELIARIDEIKQDLLNGMTRKEIVSIYSKKFGVSDRTIDTYLKEAYSQINDLNEEQFNTNKQLLEAKVLRVFQGALAKEDYSSSLKALELIGKLQGTFSAEKIEQRVTTINKEIASKSTNDLIQLVKNKK